MKLNNLQIKLGHRSTHREPVTFSFASDFFQNSNSDMEGNTECEGNQFRGYHDLEGNSLECSLGT